MTYQSFNSDNTIYHSWKIPDWLTNCADHGMHWLQKQTQLMLSVLISFSSVSVSGVLCGESQDVCIVKHVLGTPSFDTMVTPTFS